MPTLYQFHPSGNCYKVRLTAHHVGVELTLRDVDMMGGETRRPDFLAINPNGRVPTLVLDDGKALPESNAAMWWLAEGTGLLPDDKWGRAQTLQWLFFEQYSHEPYIATRRFWLAFAPKDKLAAKEHMLQPWLEGGYAALAVMEKHLAERKWFVGDRLSIADIALYAYTHCADEGGFSLNDYPHVRAWLDRVASHPRHVTIHDRP